METMTSFIFHLHFKIFLENNTAPMSLLINEPKHCSQRWFICRITFQDSNWCWYHIYYGLTDGMIKRWDVIWPRAVKHSQSRQYVSNNCGKTLSCNNDEVFLRVTNHTGQVEKNLLRHSEKHLIIILYPSSLSHNNNLKLSCNVGTWLPQGIANNHLWPMTLSLRTTACSMPEF